MKLGQKLQNFVMFRNRFMRFLSTVILFVIYEVLSVLLCKTFRFVGTGAEDAGLYFWLIPFSCFIACFVGQFFGDILNIDGCFNDDFFTIIKRIAFIIVCGFSMVFGSAMSANMPKMEDPSAFGLALIYSWAFTPTLIYAGYTFLYPSYNQQKCRLPLFYLISLVGGYLLGLIYAFVCLDYPEIGSELYLLYAACVVWVVGIIYAFWWASGDGDRAFDECGNLLTSSGYDSSRYTTMYGYQVDTPEEQASADASYWAERQREQAEAEERRNLVRRSRCADCKYFWYDNEMVGRCSSWSSVRDRVSADDRACDDFNN